MTQRNPSNQADFVFEVQAQGTAALLVTGFTGHEAASNLFSFQVDLCTSEADLDKTALLGQACRLTLREGDARRVVSGIVRSFARTGQGSDLTHYAAEIVPVHWYLSRRHQSRILQAHLCADMSVPGIIRHVLETAGIPDTHFRFALQDTYEPHDCIVQYRETDLAFIMRLIENEGLHFFFEHEDDRHVLVIADGDVAHLPAGYESLPFRTPSGLVPSEPVVSDFVDRRAIEIDAVSLDDFDFRKPPQQLRTNLAGDGFPALIESDYPGGYAERTDGDRLTKIRLEAHQVGRHEVRLKTTARGLRPGLTVTLREHPDETCNREYLVLAATHTAHQPQSAAEEAGAAAGPQYEAEVRAIPIEIPYRTPRNTPVPQVAGSQTALVVGPPGEEIWPDEYGRVKVQFHWDQAGTYNEESSAWIRVSQGWAGGRYGMFFLPRIGQEVVVDFLEGDPNRPLITGSVHNKDNMPPVQLPDEKTCSVIRSRSTVGGGGANELRFEDRKDEELLFLHAQRNLHLRSLNDSVTTVGRDAHLQIERDTFTRVEQNAQCEIKLDRTEKVGGSSSLEVSGDQAEVIKGNRSIKVAGNHILKSDGTLVIESSAGICLKVGGNFITIDPSGIYVMGTIVHVNGSGAALNGNVLSAAAPEEPLVASTTEPGTDVSYQADPDTPGQIELTTQSGGPDEDEDGSPDEASWIEIELVDQAGLPVPGEAYEVTSPSGQTYTGSLDADGRAHLAVDQPGMCQVSFPRLDFRAWARTAAAESTSTASGTGQATQTEEVQS